MLITNHSYLSLKSPGGLFVNCPQTVSLDFLICKLSLDSMGILKLKKQITKKCFSLDQLHPGISNYPERNMWSV